MPLCSKKITRAAMAEPPYQNVDFIKLVMEDGPNEPANVEAFFDRLAALARPAGGNTNVEAPTSLMYVSTSRQVSKSLPSLAPTLFMVTNPGAQGQN